MPNENGPGAGKQSAGANIDPKVISANPAGTPDKDELRASLSGRETAPKKELLPVVGLFGTCGNSTWRDPVMKELCNHNIQYFNPVVPNWTAECGAIEAKHANTDKVVLMVITGETEAAGSLAETGWIENSIERDGQGRKAVFVIEDYHEAGQPVDPKHQANRARTLVKKHAKEAGVPVYTSIEPALKEVIKDFEAAA